MKSSRYTFAFAVILISCAFIAFVAKLISGKLSYPSLIFSGGCALAAMALVGYSSYLRARKSCALIPVKSQGKASPRSIRGGSPRS